MGLRICLVLVVLARVAQAAPTTWISPEKSPWRVPIPANDIAILDDKRGVIITDTDVMLVDRKSGDVGAPSKVLADNEAMERVARVGTRLLAFGKRDDTPAVWELSFAPPRAMPLTVQDPGPSSQRGLPRVVASPDGGKLAICSRDRSPVVRDAKTLAILHVAKNTECIRIRWIDEEHVVIGRSTESRAIRVSTGVLGPRDDDAPIVTGGPRGLRWIADENGFAIGNAKGKLRASSDRSVLYDEVLWSPDGAFAVNFDGSTDLGIHGAATNGRDRSATLPLGSVMRFAIDATSILVLGEHGVMSIDLASGAVRRGSDTIAAIRDIAVHRGAVHVVSDTLRTWRGGKVASAGKDLVWAAAPGDSATVVLGTEHLAWRQSDGTETTVGDAGSWSLLSRAGDEVLYGDERTIFAATRTSAKLWKTTGPDQRFVAIDARSKRAALASDDTFHIVGEAKPWQIQVADSLGACGTFGNVEFGLDGKQLGISGSGGVHLYNSVARKRLGRIELPLFEYTPTGWTFTPQNEVVLAGVDELVIWDIATSKARSWKLPLRELPMTIAVDETGNELAIGYGNGRVLWANLAEIRGAAKPRAGKLAPPKTCKKS